MESSAPKKDAVRSSETVATTFSDYAHNDNHVPSMSTKSYTRNVCQYLLLVNIGAGHKSMWRCAVVIPLTLNPGIRGR